MSEEKGFFGRLVKDLIRPEIISYPEWTKVFGGVFFH